MQSPEHPRTSAVSSVGRARGRVAVIWVGLVIGILTVMALWPEIFGPRPDDVGDIHAHLLLVKDMGDKAGGWNLYSIFFPLVYLLSLGSKNYDVLAWVGTVILTASVIAKGILSYFVLREASCGRLVAALASVALALVMPLPDWWKPSSLYLDKIAPTIWFNSTTMLAVPFAILLFFAAVKWLDQPTIPRFLWVVLFSLLSVLSKPNYVLAIAPVEGGVVLIKASVQRKPQIIRACFLYAGLVLVLVAVLCFQYYDTTSSGPWANAATGKQTTHIILAPFAVWSLYSHNIPVSLLLSIAFPISVVVVYFKEIRRNAAFGLAWAVLAVALLQYVLFAEGGELLWDANWIWGSNIAVYIVFLVSAAVFAAQPRSPRFYFVLTLFSLHLAAGIYYFVKVALGLGYD
jgi:hypothetical protein